MYKEFAFAPLTSALRFLPASLPLKLSDGYDCGTVSGKLANAGSPRSLLPQKRPRARALTNRSFEGHRTAPAARLAREQVGEYFCGRRFRSCSRARFAVLLISACSLLLPDHHIENPPQSLKKSTNSSTISKQREEPAGSGRMLPTPLQRPHEILLPSGASISM
jgi:hypothetical protein